MHRRLNTATPLETEIIDDTGEQSKEDQNIKDFNDWNSFFKIGCFGFGGPMAVFGMLQDEFVVRKKILTNNDFLEGAVLGDILPGPVTMDIVTYTGYKLNKWSGALKATLLFILPSFVMMLIFAIYYDRLVIIPQIDSIFKCLGAAVAGLILSVGMRLGQQEVRDYYAVGIFLWAFISSFIFKFDILWVVLLSGIAGMLLFFKSYTAHSTNEEILQPGITKE
jgi:chromate transporter